MGKTKLKPQKPPKDLEDQWGATQALALAFNTIKLGYFPATAGDAPTKSMSFLKALHDLNIETCLAHKNADLIPELKEIKDKKEAQDGSKEDKTRKETKITDTKEHGEATASPA